MNLEDLTSTLSKMSKHWQCTIKSSDTTNNAGRSNLLDAPWVIAWKWTFNWTLQSFMLWNKNMIRKRSKYCLFINTQYVVNLFSVVTILTHTQLNRHWTKLQLIFGSLSAELQSLNLINTTLSWYWSVVFARIKRFAGTVLSFNWN